MLLDWNDKIMNASSSSSNAIGLACLVLGCAVSFSAALGAVYVFGNLAASQEASGNGKTKPLHQSNQKRRAQNKYTSWMRTSLWTVLPTLAWIMITFLLLVWMKNGHVYGPEKVLDFGLPLLALFALMTTIAILADKQHHEHDDGQRGRQRQVLLSVLPLITCLAFFLASGALLVEMGRQLLGSGYNEMIGHGYNYYPSSGSVSDIASIWPPRAYVVEWRAVIDNENVGEGTSASLLDIIYTTRQGTTCEATVRLDCKLFWQDISRKEENAQQGNDDGQNGTDDDATVYNVNAYNSHEETVSLYQQQENPHEIILTRILLSRQSSEADYNNDDDQSEDQFFDCRAGFIWNAQEYYNQMQENNNRAQEYYQRQQEQQAYNNNNRQLEEEAVYNKGGGNYNDDTNDNQPYDDYYSNEVENSYNDDGLNSYWVVDGLLVNSHQCGAAAFYSPAALQREFLRNKPVQSLFLCLLAASISAIISAFCLRFYYPTRKCHPGTMTYDRFVEA